MASRVRRDGTTTPPQGWFWDWLRGLFTRQRSEWPERNERMLQEAVDMAYGALRDSEYVGGPTEREAWQKAVTVLGAVATQHKGASREKGPTDG